MFKITAQQSATLVAKVECLFLFLFFFFIVAVSIQKVKFCFNDRFSLGHVSAKKGNRCYIFRSYNKDLDKTKHLFFFFGHCYVYWRVSLESTYFWCGFKNIWETKCNKDLEKSKSKWCKSSGNFKESIFSTKTGNRS